MRAAVYTRYGAPGVMHIEDVADPVPGPHDVVIRVRASTVSAADSRVRAARFPRGFAIPARLAFGVLRPRRRVLGTDLSGTIERVGSAVTRFRPGDEVIALSGISFGCHAELKMMPESAAIALAPKSIALDEAAALLFGGSAALHFLRDRGRLKPGERVLVNGAAGAVGSAAVQIAKAGGAHVTAVCSASNAAFAATLGADAVITHTSQDFATTGETWDVIFDTVGNATFGRCKPLLNRNGRLLLAAADLPQLLKAPLQSYFSGYAISGGPAPERAEDLIELAHLCDAGVLRPVVGSRHTLDRIAEAHALADSGRKRGSALVVIERR